MDGPGKGGGDDGSRAPLELGARVLEVLDRWDRRLEAASGAWAELSPAEQQWRETELDTAGESEEWVVALWSWWQGAPLADQQLLRLDVTVLAEALWAAAGDGRLDGASDEAQSARHLLRALERMRRILADRQS